ASSRAVFTTRPAREDAGVPRRAHPNEIRYKQSQTTGGQIMNPNKILNSVAAVAMNVGLKILAAFVLYMIGRWLIGLAVKLMHRALNAQHIDATIQRYLDNIVSVVLNIALVVAILGYFGVETTSFAALLAGAGLAIGTAWGGLLSNFAAGAFFVILRPYKGGDSVNAGDVSGTGRAIGLFGATTGTPRRVQTHIGNGKILSGTIQNFSANPLRRVDITAQLHYSVPVADAIARLKVKLAEIPNTSKEQGPDVEVLQFTEFGPVLAVRPYTHT